MVKYRMSAVDKESAQKGKAFIEQSRVCIGQICIKTDIMKVLTLLGIIQHLQEKKSGKYDHPDCDKDWYKF